MQRSGIGTVQSASVRTLDLAGFTELRRLSRNRLHNFHPAFTAVAVDPGDVGTEGAGTAGDLLPTADFVGLVAPGTTHAESSHSSLPSDHSSLFIDRDHQIAGFR